MEKKIVLDRRIQRTRQLLLNALIELILEKGYPGITVQDIIDRANVGRSTFYFHFQDKEDLLLSGFENLRDIFDEFQNSTLPEKTNWEFSAALFQHAEEHRLVFKAIFGKEAGAVVLKHVQKELSAYLKKHFQENFPKKVQPAIPLDILVQYFVSTFLGLMTWWLENDISYSAQQMNSYFRKLTDPTISMLLSDQPPGDSAY